MYRLRRMYLVNAGTNKQRPSRRISNVDPCGHAAILGDNGVGKTSTLKLKPLFYGHLPSQLVQAGHGQKSLPRFALPTLESAIVFEYQRGPSETADVRLAVLRAKKDNPDSIEYRLFESAFRRELFVDADGIFLDDHGSKTAAAAQGVNCSGLLSTSEYRTVILNLRSNTKDAQKLKLLARDYSFAPKPMPNLDRLVASVVKEHINFADLIQVAVGMVNEEMGANTGAERNKLLLKQTKTEITDWIRNRRACEDAMKMTAQVDALEGYIDRFHRDENDIRLLACEVSSLLDHKSNTLELAAGRRDEASAQRRRAEDEAQETLTHLTVSLDTALEARREANQSFLDQDAQKQRFIDLAAEGWAKRQESVPLLNAERQSIVHQRQVSAAAAESIDAEIRAAKEQVEADRDEAIETLDGEAIQARERNDIRIASLTNQKKDAVDAARERHASQATKTSEAILSAVGALSRVRALAERIEGPDDLREVVTTLRDEIDEVGEQVNKARTDALQRNREHAAARRAFDELDAEVISTKTKVENLHHQIASLEASLFPEDGTFHAALKARPREEWDNLAKFVAPEHLARTDLVPNFDATADLLSAFGWTVDLEKLPLPSWASEDETRAQIATAQQRLQSALSLLEEVKAKRDAASSRVTAAQEMLSHAESELSLLEKNKNTKTQSLERAKCALEQAKKDERDAFAKDEKRLSKGVETLKITQNTQTTAAKAELQAIEGRFDTEIWSAGTAAKAEQTAFEEKRKAIKKQATEHLKSLDDQKKDRYRQKQLDPDKIVTWDTRRSEIDAELREIEDRAPLIDQWRAWLKANGPAELVRLEEELRNKDSNLTVASSALKEYKALVERTAEAYRVQQAKLEKEIEDLTEQCRKLKALVEELPPPIRDDVSINREMTAGQIIVIVDEARNRLATTKRRIDNVYNTIYNRLTERESNVKDFAEKSVSEATTSPVDKALALVNCHRRIPGEIVSNLNNTLRVILDTIERFHGAILSFETEIKRFNKNLLKGLQSVQQFERIKDLEIEMVTDFSDLSFMERLKKVSQFANETHFTLGRTGQRREVPDVNAEIVLHDFASAIASGGRLEVDLAQHVRLRGRVMENGIEKSFQRESELENVSSNGLTSIILITLLLGMLNMIRGTEKVFITWVTDEVGKFDGPNFLALMDMLRDNRIDVVTASPELNPRHFRKFAQRYRFEDLGVIRTFEPPRTAVNLRNEPMSVSASGDFL